MTASESRDVPTVLFLCVHNAGRSQMAAAWCRHLGGAGVSVRSAGTAPASAVHPAVVEAMREVGLDVTQSTPQLLSVEAMQQADVVVTMGCGDDCPYVPGTRYLDWALDDPAGQPLAVVRGIRDEIRERVRALLAELGVTEVVDPTGAGGSDGGT
jgi:protein-tyrosine-phosphatase